MLLPQCGRGVGAARARGRPGPSAGAHGHAGPAVGAITKLTEGQSSSLLSPRLPDVERKAIILQAFLRCLLGIFDRIFGKQKGQFFSNKCPLKKPKEYEIAPFPKAKLGKVS